MCLQEDPRPYLSLIRDIEMVVQSSNSSNNN